MAPLVISRQQARQIAVRAQLLTAQRPTDLVQTVTHLTLLQLDPTSAVAPAAELVAWSRLGAAFHRDELVAALTSRCLLEWAATIRPAADIVVHLPELKRWASSPGAVAWVAANRRCHEAVLGELGRRGPLLSRDLPQRCDVPWTSSGWTHERSMTKLLELMVARGEVAIAGRQGRQRLWDLAERVYPTVEAVAEDQARRVRNERRLRSLGIARAKAAFTAVEPWGVGETGQLARVEGVRGTWRVDERYLEGAFDGRTALLCPFDRLVHDRKRARELFDFEYQLEIYKPVQQRRWGYYALPILHLDQLVGKVDATVDRERAVLQVHAVHEDLPFDARAVRDELEALAQWLDVDLQMRS